MRNLVATIMLLAAIVPAAQAGKTPPVAVTSCETVISNPGSYFLDNDLYCGSDAYGVAIIADNVDFDLKTHFIYNNNQTYVGAGIGTGVPPFQPNNGCVAVSGLHIHGGAVAGFSMGIAICSPPGKNVSSNNLVQHVGLVDNITGIAIYGTATNNQIEFNSVSKNSTGIYLGDTTSGNDIGSNGIISEAVGVVIDSSSNANNVHGNTITQMTGNGLSIKGNNNTIQGNFSIGNGGAGFEAFALSTGNKITGNFAQYNHVDALDDNGFCGINTWSVNFLGGGGNPACIQ
jgi:hypothetical protein